MARKPSLQEKQIQITGYISESELQYLRENRLSITQFIRDAIAEHMNRK